MDTEEFRKRGREMVEYICKYNETIKERRVTPSVAPGYLRKFLPSEAPQTPDNWDDVMNDVETKIMPGVTHWQHPRFHAYFPAGTCYPAILGNMLCDAINCLGFSWASSPVCSELETIVTNWIGKAIGLPDDFLALNEDSTGGGVIQSSASESILVSMLAARSEAVKRLRKMYPSVEEGHLLSKLIAYCSREAHSCVEKDAMIAFVKIRILGADENGSLNANSLIEAMEADTNDGLMPFFVSTTLGTTGSCSFDNLDEIGNALKKFPDVWLHVDAAYAGSAFICPELRPFLNGIEYVDSIDTNPHKWLLTCCECSLLWIRDRVRLTSALAVDPLYLKHCYSDAVIDYRNWTIPLSRPFRALKLWFVVRSYGLSGLRKYIRNHIQLAKRFENHVRRDERFEVCNDVRLGLVCFRLIGADVLTEKLLNLINESGKLHMVPAQVNKKFIIRFCVCIEKACEDDIDTAWQVIQDFATELREKKREITEILQRMHEENVATLCPAFTRMISDTEICNCAIHEPEFHTPARNRSSISWVHWPLEEHQ